MLINILATDNYNSYNIELARSIGLHEAIYLNEIINIQEKAYRKNKIVYSYVELDREYIQSRTTFKVEEQKELQKALEICKLIKVDENNKDRVLLESNNLINMLYDGNESILKSYAKEVKNTKKESKAEIIRQQLKNNIKTDNVELKDAYCEWIDSVSMKFGYMAKKAVIEGQKVIDDYCNRDLDKALKIISIATINSYRDMTWAINDFKKDYAKSFNRVPIIQNVNQLSNEVF